MPQAPFPEDEILNAVVDKAERVKQFGGERVLFTFRVQVPGHTWDNMVVWGNTPTTFTTHPSCRLAGWVRELLFAGDLLPRDYLLDLADLEGVSCRVVLGAKVHYDGGYNFVQAVMRPRGATPPDTAAALAALQETALRIRHQMDEG